MLGGGEDPAPPPAEEEETQVIPEHTRKVPKRRDPSDDWPRVYIELVPPEVECEGLDAFAVIGQESRVILERRPASCVFVKVVRKKFVRKSDKGAIETGVLIADSLALPIPKGIAGPNLLAETVVKRWCDHQPLHRQESIFARDGLELARSTLSEWHVALALLAATLIQGSLLYSSSSWDIASVARAEVNASGAGDEVIAAFDKSSATQIYVGDGVLSATNDGADALYRGP